MLWFRPVSRSALRPVELVGNVAELVTLEPVDPRPLLEAGQPLTERRRAFRAAFKNSFAVIGGSALSPASIQPDDPQPFNVFSGARGYADVGLRLAFAWSAPPPGGRRAQAMLLQQPFLTREK